MKWLVNAASKSSKNQSQRKVFRMKEEGHHTTDKFTLSFGHMQSDLVPIWNWLWLLLYDYLVWEKSWLYIKSYISLTAPPPHPPLAVTLNLSMCSCSLSTYDGLHCIFWVKYFLVTKSVAYFLTESREMHFNGKLITYTI